MPTKTNHFRHRPMIRKTPRLEQLEDRRVMATFQGLGDLIGGLNFSDAYGVSDDGQVVVGESRGAGDAFIPFRWTADEGMIALDTGTSSAGVARGASADGGLVVGVTYTPSVENATAVKWDSSGVATIASPVSSAWGVSSTGQYIVGQLYTGGVPEANLWDTVTGSVTALGTLFAEESSEARAVSDDGRFVTGEATNQNSGRDAFLWSADAGLVSLGFEGTGNDLSADGSVVVGWEDVVTKVSRKGRRTDSHFEAFRWTSVSGQAEKDLLGDLPGGEYQSLAYAVSSDGQVIGGMSNSSRGQEAFVWTEETGMRSFQEVLVQEYGVDLTGWQLVTIRDISADGSTFVGLGTNPNGDSEAFIASLDPPSPGISISSAGPLETSEAGATVSFEVVLDTQPTSDVTISVSSSDSTEGVVDQSTLTFTPTSWDVAQTFVVAGVDDTEVDGDVEYQVQVEAMSGDTSYDTLTARSLILTNIDDDGVTAAEVFYVNDIRFDSRRGGKDWRAVFEIRHDSNNDGFVDESDALVDGASITVSFNGQLYAGTTDSDGTFRTPWQNKLADGEYYAEVLDLVFAELAWDLALGEDDSNDNGLPDALLSIQ